MEGNKNEYLKYCTPNQEYLKQTSMKTNEPYSLYIRHLWENISNKVYNPQATIVKNASETHSRIVEFLIHRYKEDNAYDLDYFLNCVNEANERLFLIIEREI